MNAKNWCVLLVLLVAGCGREKVRLFTHAEIEQQTPFRATVRQVNVVDMTEIQGGSKLVVLVLEKETGERIGVGGERQSRTFEDFARMLTRDASYQFPAAWLDYKKEFEARDGDTNKTASSR